MLQTTHQAAKPADATSLFDLVRDGGSALLASIRQRRQAARDSSTLEALSDAQLAEDCALPGGGGYAGGAYNQGWVTILRHFAAALESTDGSTP